MYIKARSVTDTVRESKNSRSSVLFPGGTKRPYLEQSVEKVRSSAVRPFCDGIVFVSDGKGARETLPDAKGKRDG